MKKLIVTACAAIASAVAVASTVESSNTFGVLKLQASDGTNKKQFFIGVPWEAVGASGATAQKISPKDLVLTTGLNAGDLLIYYSSSSPKAWILAGGVWTAPEQISSGVVRDFSNATPSWKVYTTATDGTTVTRGEGLLLETAAQYVYLSGQYEKDAPDEGVTVVPATPEIKEAYTLIGNYSADTTMEIEASHPQLGDKIFVNNNVYWYKVVDSEHNGWTTYQEPSSPTVPANWVAAVPTIAPGCGAWYLTTSTVADNTITLSTPSN